LPIEASSHGLDQHRLDGLKLAAAAFTNLTHEHLDYHPSMEAYFSAKARLFESLLPTGATAIVNADSDRAAALAEICKRRGLRFWTYGAAGREFCLLRDEPTSSGQHLEIEVLGTRHEVDLPLVGGFQASNALAALGLVVATGGDAARAVAALAGLTGAPGRLQLVGPPQDRRAGLCRLCAQARSARDRAQDAAALHPRPAGRGVRLRRRSRSRQASGDGRNRHTPRRPHHRHRR
jgi:UDP-N-acetylmuramoyl-L-alanyl-D-glutamate--2,6-diaminopimelate ligase